MFFGNSSSHYYVSGTHIQCDLRMVQRWPRQLNSKLVRSQNEIGIGLISCEDYLVLLALCLCEPCCVSLCSVSVVCCGRYRSYDTALIWFFLRILNPFSTTHTIWKDCLWTGVCFFFFSELYQFLTSYIYHVIWSSISSVLSKHNTVISGDMIF